ncbi:MAG: [FeFe] hydrogenase, group A [Bacteroidales bacterium]|jgi:NADH-quinone oxidoreductase subunit G/NADP-reducing hydrogenase subunit HndD|nr:[FeFe] hydrogenase, group A [Bacteroidales bacterium]
MNVDKQKETILIEVNGKEIEAVVGETILSALNREGIRVPTLCHMKGFIPSGACRICVVELGNGRLVSSCSYPVEPGMKIQTHSSTVLEARKTIVELLLANHPDDCLFCLRNNNCELQSLAKEYHVMERRIRGNKNSLKLDHSGPSIVRDPEKCILCGRCVRVCEERIGVACIDYINRGSKTFIGTTLKQPLNTSSCVNCGQCILACPTGALTEKNNVGLVLEALKQKEKMVVVQYAPSISVSIAEAFGMTPGEDLNGAMNAALRRMGFNHVFDTTFGADLTIMEEASELVERVKNGGKLPMFTSCCPGWVKYAEEFAPDMLENLSTCKSPQQMTGAMIKTYFANKVGVKPENIISVSIMPCTAKKFECERDTMGRDGLQDVDIVITSRELIEMINIYGIDLKTIEKEGADSPLGIRSTAGKIFGATGGVMEAALRSGYHFITGGELGDFRVTAVRGDKGRKEAKIKISDDLELGVAVISGLGNAMELINEIRNGRSDIHFIEVMTCPGGCINGGGQRIGAKSEDVSARAKALYNIDETETLRLCHKNPEIIELYNEFLGAPLKHKSHEYLHTHYAERDVLL